MESIPLTTSDGHSLAADLLMPDAAPIGGVVVCHPHPQHGGNRHHPVVDAMFRRLPEIGLATLRFDFRADFGGGVAERDVVIAALDELDRRGVGSLAVAGYSFGAAVTLATDDPRVTAAVAVAAPLAVMTVDPPSFPVLLLVPEHDQFTAPDAALAATADWPAAEVRSIDSADHFVVGQASTIGDVAAEWLLAER